MVFIKNMKSANVRVMKTMKMSSLLLIKMIKVIQRFYYPKLKNCEFKIIIICIYNI